MSAYVETDYVYYAVCPDCATGSTTYASEEDAEEWAAEHNAENHEDDDPAEIARQEWKDTRNDAP